MVRIRNSGRRRNGSREDAFVGRVFEFDEQFLPHFAGKCEALVFAADPRDRAVHEHQRKVLRVIDAESIQAEDDAVKAIGGGKAIEGADAAVAEEPHAFFSQGDEDFVL